MFVDGILGPETLWTLQHQWANEKDQQFTLVRCTADPIQGGYSHLMLREDVAVKYNAVRQSVLLSGGKITTSGGLRDLTELADQNRSSKSMHYPGLAFDLGVNSGFFNPDEDNFVVQKNEISIDKPYWTVWCKAECGDNIELEASYWKTWNSGVDLKKVVSGKFINFTKLCIENGLFPIHPRSAYTRPTNRSYLSSEWWHFQANSLLIPNLSQVGIELLRINTYTESTIAAVNKELWENRKSIFGKTWF